MKTFKLLTLILAYTVFSFSQVNYYFSTINGNDSNNGLSPKAPFASLNILNQLWSKINPGDSILLERGSHFAPSSVPDKMFGIIDIPNGKSGTPDKPITIGAYGSGNRPIIDGSKITGYHQGFKASSISYFVIQDLEFWSEIYFKANDNRTNGIHHIKFLRNKLVGKKDPNNITRMYLYNPYYDNNGNLINTSLVPQLNNVSPLDDIEIGWCEFYDTQGEDAVNIKCAGNRFWVHHNIWKNVNEEALDIGGGNGHIIEYNFVSGTTVNGMKFHSQSNPQSNLVFRGNVIISAGSQGNALALQNLINSKIYNNTIYSLYAAFFGNRDRIQPDSYYGNFEGNEIFNNIFCGVIQIQGSWKDANIGNQILYNDPSNNLLKDNKFSNNIYWTYPETNTLIRFWENGQYPDETAKVNDTRTISKFNLNKFESDWASKSSGNENAADPMFVNPYWFSAYDCGDFQVKEGSPAINSGLSISEWTEDITGKVVSSGSKPTIGAYQYGSGGVVVTKPKLLSATPTDLTKIVLVFSKNLNESSAENINCYSISGNVEVKEAQLSVDRKTVILYTSKHNPEISYTISISNLFDVEKQIIDANYSTALYTFSFGKLNVIDVEESEADFIDPATNKLNTIDGNLSTRWAAKVMPQYLIYDLGSIKKVSKTRFSFYNWNNNRIYNYSVFLSEDKTQWTEVLSNVNSQQEEWSTEYFNAAEARYIKLLFNYATDPDPNFPQWANIWEAEIYSDEVITDTNNNYNKDFIYQLEQNYPNPFNPSTNIKFSLAATCLTKLSVYDLLGQKVKTLVNETLEKGIHNIEFDASGLSSGVYFYKLEIPGNTITKKMMLIR